MKNLLILCVVVLIASILGCESGDNPVCTDNFCIVPRGDVTGDIIEIDEAKVLALISSDVLLSQETTPEATPDQDTNIFDLIVSDASTGGTTYLNQTVTITFTVKFDNAQLGNVGAISLVTANDNVSFFISDFANPAAMDGYMIGETYTESVFIRNIRESESTAGRWVVFADLA